MKAVNINSIRIDGGTQSRVVISQDKIYEYAEAMREGDEFPPMRTVFDGITHWLVDGFHRYHSYKVLNVSEVNVVFTLGSQLEAQVISFGMNATHGLPRTNADKTLAVNNALVHPLTKDQNDSQLAKTCAVSRPFVAAVRNPEAKERHQKAREKHIIKKAEELSGQGGGSNPITTHADAGDEVATGAAPDDEEMLALQAAHEADMQAMAKMLESNDALKTAYEEIQRLNRQVSLLDARVKGLMGERNEAIKMVKSLEGQLKKLRNIKP